MDMQKLAELKEMLSSVMMKLDEMCGTVGKPEEEMPVAPKPEDSADDMRKKLPIVER